MLLMKQQNKQAANESGYVLQIFSDPDQPGVCLFIGAPKGNIPDNEINL